MRRSVVGWCVWGVLAIWPSVSASFSVAADAPPAKPVSIVVAPKAAALERLAAAELAAYLGKMYADCRFAVGPSPEAAIVLRIGTVAEADLKSLPAAAGLTTPESFVVTTTKNGDRDVGLILGADAAGTLSGVYALLEHLGCGFYLSYEFVPTVKEPFALTGWNLADAPLIAERIAFDWHNFLSGCSAWNLPEWKLWIAHSRKMRFNTIMVHAYANNPMFTFSYLDVTKEVGWLPSTRHGRDWGTAHLNDVRRLPGGDLFDDAIFGADAAKLPAEQQPVAVQRLMKAVFADAAARGLHVCFALDIDTANGQPQDILRKLPAAARFEVAVKGNRTIVGQSPDRIWLAIPDTPEGYAYYREQTKTLLDLYPQIDRLALWMRKDGSPWLALQRDQLPAAWQAQYDAELAKTPAAAKLPGAAGRFATAKVLVAFQKALGELGYSRVRLVCGSWGFDWLESSDRFFPRGVAMLPLDYDVLLDRPEFEKPERVELLRRLSAERPVWPIVWAHHDDGQYIGRPYRPPTEFARRLAECGSPGFGIIHWTTRPLDLYFKSLARQVWKATADETLDATCRFTAARWTGAVPGAKGDAGRAEKTCGEYLLEWMKTAPIFGRETTDWFIDRLVTAENLRDIVAASAARRKLLDSVDPQTLPALGGELWQYQRGMEDFYVAFHRNEYALQQSLALLAAGDLDAARREVKTCDPVAAIRTYAQAIRHGGVNRGELGVLLALGGNWLPYFDNQRQALALAPVLYDFGPTSHELLAQGAGRLTFYADPQGRLWRQMGQHETGAEEYSVSASTKIAAPDTTMAEVSRNGITTARPLTVALRPCVFDLQPFRKKPPVAGDLTPGEYRVRLWFFDATSTAAKQRVFDVAVRSVVGGKESSDVLAGEQLDLFQRCDGKPRPVEVEYRVTLPARGWFTITLTPRVGQTILNAAIVEPAK